MQISIHDKDFIVLHIDREELKTLDLALNTLMLSTFPYEKETISKLKALRKKTMWALEKTKLNE